MNVFEVTLSGVALAGSAPTFAITVTGSGPPGPQGTTGPVGPSGIIVSETAPPDPVEGQLWLQITA